MSITTVAGVTYPKDLSAHAQEHVSMGGVGMKKITVKKPLLPSVKKGLPMSPLTKMKLTNGIPGFKSGGKCNRKEKQNGSSR